MRHNVSNEMITVAISMRKMRKRTGMSRREVQAKSGVKAVTLKEWESAIIKPNVISLIHLANLYGCTLDELVGRYDKTPLR